LRWRLLLCFRHMGGTRAGNRGVTVVLRRSGAIWSRGRRVLRRAWQSRPKPLLVWRHLLFARLRHWFAIRAGLRTSWCDMPAGQRGKLLAARQAMGRGRLVLWRCARRFLSPARQCWLGLLLAWRHRLFARPWHWSAICARLGALWRGMPAGQRGKLLAARQAMSRGPFIL
jgi:hypothetical protein